MPAFLIMHKKSCEDCYIPVIICQILVILVCFKTEKVHKDKIPIKTIKFVLQLQIWLNIKKNSIKKWKKIHVNWQIFIQVLIFALSLEKYHIKLNPISVQLFVAPFKCSLSLGRLDPPPPHWSD